ncbi:MAG: GTP cyclohydrolase I, partial [Chitinophagales bacterium]
MDDYIVNSAGELNYWSGNSIADNDAHFSASLDTPLTAKLIALSDAEKIDRITHHFRHIMETLGLDLSDDSLKDTPRRVAKMYVQEIFNGLNPKNKPAITLFDNSYKYNQMLVEKNIRVASTCEHHFVPIIGKAHV